MTLLFTLETIRLLTTTKGNS